ncbi:cytidine deaminase [Shewanella maritima]|uniref:cytidine deaminase n=1 Tax=Shewanella maritima TaxID=2520507 RepID=UPI003734F61B
MQDRFVKNIAQLPTPLADALIPHLGDGFNGYFSAAQVNELATAAKLDEQALLLALLPIAAAMATPGISHFYVGAIAKGISGDIYMGANLELPGESLFHSVHAEQSAISHAWLKGEKQIVDVVVNFSPCGHCRQFMNELVEGSKVMVHLPEQDAQPLIHYLPYPFGPKDLNVHHPLLSESKQSFELNTNDPVTMEALAQLEKSYAPYTSNFAAVVLETKDGKMFAGRYAENAAFNPSMQPMQMALSNLSRNNYRHEDISRAILVESSQGQISLVGAAMDALHAIAAIELEHVVIEPSV